MTQTQAPSTTPAPGLTPSQITINGVPLPDAPGAASVYRAFRAERQELSDQLGGLLDTRSSLMSQLQQLPAGSVGRTGIEQRIAGVDTRIAEMDKQIGLADAQVAKAAAVPGAVVEPPRFVERGPPQEVYVLSGMIIILVLLPLSIAYARRIWKRGAAVVAAFPKEITERLARLEQSADATALEVERIGEGQRFLTRILTEGSNAHALKAAPAEPAERKQLPGGR